MTCESSKWQKSRHISYLYPLWRFLSKIGYPFSEEISLLEILLCGE